MMDILENIRWLYIWPKICNPGTDSILKGFIFLFYESVLHTILRSMKALCDKMVRGIQ